MGQQLSKLPFGIPPGASLCDTYFPSRPLVFLAFSDFQSHLPFLPFQISEESDTRSQCNYVQKTPILTQTKLGKAFKTIIVKQWVGAKVANLRTGGAARKQVPVLYENDRLALARHEF